MGSGGSKKSSQGNKTNNSGGQAQPSVTPNKAPQTQSNIQVPPKEEQVIPNKVKGTSSSAKEHDNKAQPDKPKEAAMKKNSNTSVTAVGTTDSGPKQDETSKPDVTKSNQNDTNGEKDVRENENKTVVTPNVVERLIEEGNRDQQKFDTTFKSASLLIKQDSVYKHITKNVTKLYLPRALPLHFSLNGLLNKFGNLKDLDVSNNDMGPQCFRAICLAMCGNSTILSLNLARNKADTDSADCLGRMMENNNTLQYLDVSSNYLGKDYFSRKIGPVLKTNTSLKTLRCESIGTTDARLFMEGIQANTSLTELDFSRNDISDKVGFGKGLAENLKRPDCVLTSLCLSRCGLNAAGIKEFQKGLEENRSIQELNLTGSEFDSLDMLLGMAVACIKHPCLRTLSLDSAKVKSTDMKSDIAKCESVSTLEIISLSSCGLTNNFFTSLQKICQGKLLSLVEIDLAANDNLSVECLDCLANMTSDGNSPGSLRKIHYGLNKGDNFIDKITGQFPNLQYINLRMCHMSTDSVSKIGSCWTVPDCCLSTVILDGLKLSNTSAVKDVLENAKSGKLSTISFGGCSLDDKDLSPLCDAIKNGVQLHMLKLSANRITDMGVAMLVDAVMANKTHPLAVLDLSNNRIEDEGCKSLMKLFCTKSHTSRLHSLNVSGNNIGRLGALSLVAVIGGKHPLHTLHMQGQSSGLDEGHMVEIFTKLAESLGYKVQMDGDKVIPGCSDIPSNLPDGLVVNLTNMGGNTGSIGQAMDSLCIRTDYPQDRLPSLSLQQVMEICCFMKGLEAERCVWSEMEWDLITGADRATTDTPSWLKVSADRDKCVYLSNLPGHATLQKVDAILEMEVDCNLDETCLMKDPVTRSINGVGWTMMSDQESVQKAVDFFNNGEAKIFGQAIMISEVKIHVDNEANSELEKKAMIDRDDRAKLRAKEDTAHRTLIINTAEETWKRHAYRLAHPAYADGRIW